jgi:hypothetical protein
MNHRLRRSPPDIRLRKHKHPLFKRAVSLGERIRNCTMVATPASRCPAIAVRRTFLAVCIVFVALPLAPHSSFAAFVAVPQQLISDPSLLRLERADALRIQYSAIAYNSSVADLPAFRLSLDAQFGSLSQQQFDSLLAVYSFGSSKSRVVYNSSATYRFTDFLPPLLQAVSTLHFHTQYSNYSLPDVLTGQESAALCQRTQLSINCWGFAYDVLLSSQSHKPFFTLSVAHSQVAWSVLASPLFSKPLQSSNSTPDFFTNATARYTGMHPGDYFLIFHDRQLPIPRPPRALLLVLLYSPPLLKRVAFLAAPLEFSSTTSRFTSTTMFFSSGQALVTTSHSASQTGTLSHRFGRVACSNMLRVAAQRAVASSGRFPIKVRHLACTTTSPCSSCQSSETGFLPLLPACSRPVPSLPTASNRWSTATRASCGLRSGQRAHGPAGTCGWRTQAASCLKPRRVGRCCQHRVSTNSSCCLAT